MLLQCCVFFFLLFKVECLPFEGSLNNVAFVPFGKEEPLIRRVVVIPVASTPLPSRRFFSPIPGTTVHTSTATSPANITPAITTPTPEGLTASDVTIPVPGVGQDGEDQVATELSADKLPEISMPRSIFSESKPSKEKTNLERPPMKYDEVEEQGVEVEAADKPQVTVDVKGIVSRETCIN
jgi:hypothetical protein